MNIGALVIDDPAAAFTLLYGLVVEDRQIRVLLGERAPSKVALRRHADAAVERFVILCGGSSSEPAIERTVHRASRSSTTAKR